MASIISHAAAGAALSIAFAPDGTPARYWPVAIAVAVLPDADSLLYYFRISYYHTLGHRGFFHSPLLGLIISFLLMILFYIICIVTLNYLFFLHFMRGLEYQ